MTSLAVGLMLISLLVVVVGSVMILVAAFRQSVLWGLAYLLIPFAGLVFIVKYWDESKQGAKILGVGIVLLILGALLAGPADSKEQPEQVAETTKRVSSSYSTETEMARLAVPIAQPAPAAPRAEETTPVAKIEAPKKFEQVWADTATRTYYPEKCRKPPANSYKVARSVIRAQGFTEAPCP